MKPTHLAAAGLLVLVVGVGALLALRAPPGTEEPSVPAEPQRVVEVNMTTGRYFYEPGTLQPLNVSLGSLVVIRLRSADVTHGFAILEYGINVEVPPGEVVEVRFRADRAGDFTMFCTVFCGAGHPDHKGTLRVA